MNVRPERPTAKSPAAQRTGDAWVDPLVTPGEEHGHDTTPGAFMAHLALMDVPDDTSTATTWLEPVADADHHRP